jgi:hypothetical protein
MKESWGKMMYYHITPDGHRCGAIEFEAGDGFSLRQTDGGVVVQLRRPGAESDDRYNFIFVVRREVFQAAFAAFAAGARIDPDEEIIERSCLT